MTRFSRKVAAATSAALLIGTAAVVVSATSTGSPSKPALSFAKDIKPLADARCKGCHQNKRSDYNIIMSSKFVVPGKSGESPYYLKGAGKVSHGGGNAWKEKADIVKAWIDSGAAK